MVNSKKPKVTWFTAFKVLSRGKSPAIGKYPGWKSSILQMAVVSPIALLFVGGNQIRMMSGDIPPNTPIIKEMGTFVQVTHGQASYVAFNSDDGHVYNMERGTTVQGNTDYPQDIPPSKVYVEGFLRENGRGYFWPILIKTPNGRSFLTPQRSMATFHKRVESIYRLTFLYCGITCFLWIGSIYLLSVVKRNLSLEA